MTQQTTPNFAPDGMAGGPAFDSERFRGIKRDYTDADVARLSGSFRVQHTLADKGARRPPAHVHGPQGQQPGLRGHRGAGAGPAGAPPPREAASPVGARRMCRPPFSLQSARPARCRSPSDAPGLPRRPEPRARPAFPPSNTPPPLALPTRTSAPAPLPSHY